MTSRTVTRPPRYQAWVDLRRAERELKGGRAGLALALATRAHWLAPSDRKPLSLIAAVRELVGQRLPVVDAEEWISRARSVEGWLTSPEAQLLARCLAAAPPKPGATVVEIGSYKGRSTVLLALAVAGMNLPFRVVAVDPHDGYHVGGEAGTFDALKRTLQEHKIGSLVDIVRARSVEVAFPHPIAFAYIDGQHSAQSVLADHEQVAPHLLSSGLVGFHDFGDRFPGVVRAVCTLLEGNDYELAGMADSLVVLGRR